MLSPEIQSYAERFTSGESDVLRELRQLTLHDRDDSNMLSGFYQGRLLSMISRMIRPRLILEIGTYMGYSALCLAEGLAEGGRLLTLDIDEDTNKIARSFWERTQYGSMIDDHLAEAVQFIPKLDGPVDLAFIDADKENYSNYYDLLLPKMRQGGIIVADNVLWSGDVLNVEKGTSERASSKALHEYNKKIIADPAVDNLLLGVRDGLMVALVR